MAIEWRIKELQVFEYSQLVIRQVNDEYQKKDEKLILYKRMVDSFKEYFVTITFEKIPQIYNRAADVMATIGLLLDIL